MLLKTHDLTKRFRGSTILDRINLQLLGGEIVVLLGANGTGKTTLLRLLACVYGPTDGTITMDGELLNRSRVDLRRRFYLVADGPQIRSRHTVLEYISDASLLYGVTIDQMRDQLVDLMERWEVLPLADNWVGSLSRGQSYKVAMCLLEMADPDFWFLDEPFASGMDPSGLKNLSNALKRARQRGRGILFSTQIIELAERLSDQVAILHGANLIAQDSLESVRRTARESDQTELPAILTALNEADVEGPSLSNSDEA